MVYRGICLARADTDTDTRCTRCLLNNIFQLFKLTAVLQRDYSALSTADYFHSDDAFDSSPFCLSSACFIARGNYHCLIFFFFLLLFLMFSQ